MELNQTSTGLPSLPITVDPEILGGTPVFSGTRVPVKTLFDYIRWGYSLEEFLEYFPSVDGEAVMSVLAEAERMVVAASSNGNQVVEDGLAAMGWDDHGIFKNDPEALELFDQIEEERSKHFIEPIQP